MGGSHPRWEQAARISSRPAEGAAFSRRELDAMLVAVAVMKNRDERTLSLLRELKVPSDAVQRVSQHLTADLKTRAPKKSSSKLIVKRRGSK